MTTLFCNFLQYRDNTVYRGKSFSDYIYKKTNFKNTEKDKPLPGYFVHFLPVLDILKLPHVLFLSGRSARSGHNPLILTFKHSRTETVSTSVFLC